MRIPAFVNRPVMEYCKLPELDFQPQAAVRGSQTLVIPVRPTWKARYPLQRIENYAEWKNKEGLFYDPWPRTHQRLGATMIKCVESTLTI